MKKFQFKNKIVTGLMLAAAVIVTVPSMVFAYSNVSPGPTGYVPAAPYTPSVFALAGANLRVSGSTTVYPIVNHAISSGAFQAAYPTMVVDLMQGGSSQGAKDTGVGWGDLAMSSSSSSVPTTYFTQTKIARDGLEIVVNSSVTGVTQLTFAQIAGIYDRTYTNWNQLGGNDKAIKPFARILNSGSRASFLDFVKNDGLSESEEISTITAVGTVRQDGNGDMINALNATDGSADGGIGYAGYGFTDGKANIRVLAVSKTSPISYVQPSNTTIYDNTYPMARFLYVATLTGYTSDNAANAASLKNYLLSEDGQLSVKAADFLKLAPDQDVNKNGVVNVSDVAGVGAYWGQSGAPHWVRADANSNGVVNVSDVAAIGAWWGFTYTP